MRKSTSKIIEDPILDKIKSKLIDNNIDLNSLGKRSLSQGLSKELKKFINQNKKKIFENFAEGRDLYLKFSNGPSVDIISRALNIRNPCGACKELRYLIGLWLSDCKLNWNSYIDSYFPNLHHLKDNIEIKSLSISNKNKKKDLLSKVEKGIEQILEIQARREDIDKVLNVISNASNLEQQQMIMQFERSNIAKKSDKYIRSENDPNKPEFPPLPHYGPEFPATKTYKINVPGFSNVWLKDESTNPTGTHKDRMAWEVTVECMDNESIKEISLISSGSAAIAICHFFELYKDDVKTRPKILVDEKLNPKIQSVLKQKLTKLNGDLYPAQLSKKELTSKEIRDLTNIKEGQGIDITYREVMDIFNKKYYDWMSYEILNEAPDFCFVPFGTGDLLINIIKIIYLEFCRKKELKQKDPRLRSEIDISYKCNFMGATSMSENSKMDKLFSYFLPSFKTYKEFIARRREDKIIGSLSDIYPVKEEFIEEAMKISRRQKISCEPSGAAGLALLLQMSSQIPKNKKILIVNTGLTNYNPQVPSKSG